MFSGRLTWGQRIQFQRGQHTRLTGQCGLGRRPSLPPDVAPQGGLSILVSWQLPFPRVRDPRESKVEDALSFLTLPGSYTLSFLQNPFGYTSQQVISMYCRKGLHKSVTTRSQGSLGTSWKLDTIPLIQPFLISPRNRNYFLSLSLEWTSVLSS